MLVCTHDSDGLPSACTPIRRSSGVLCTHGCFEFVFVLSALTMYVLFYFDHPCYFTGVLCDVFTAFYAGLVVFSCIGFIAKEAGLPIAEVAKSSGMLKFDITNMYHVSQMLHKLQLFYFIISWLN